MLWFKNIMIYRLKRPIDLSSEDIEQRLSTYAFIPCKSQDMEKFGWISPMGIENDALVHSIPGHILLRLRKEEKILPASVIRQELQLKIHKVESQQIRRVRKETKDMLRDELVRTLIPRAFSRFSEIFVWLDLVNNRVLVDINSTKKAEDCLALLRKSVGSLSTAPLTMEKSIKLILTKWVRSGTPPTGFALQDEAELKALLEEGGIVRCKKQDLSGDEIAAHLRAGKLVTKLALDWRQQVQFVICEGGTVKKLKFADTLRIQDFDIDHNDFSSRFGTEFILMTGALAGLINELTIGLENEKEDSGGYS